LKFKLVILLGLICLGLAACGDEATSTPAPTLAPTTAPATTSAASVPATSGGIALPTIAPTLGDGMTMKQAYAVVSPMITAWNPNAVLVTVFTPPDATVGLNGAGQAPQWYFEVIDPTSGQHSTWLVKVAPDGKGSAEKSIEDVLPADQAKMMDAVKLPPLNTLIDTDRLMEVARANGGTKSDQPIGIQLASPAKEGDPLAFDLVFYNGNDVLRLRIDAQSGKLVENTKG